MLINALIDAMFFIGKQFSTGCLHYICPPIHADGYNFVFVVVYHRTMINKGVELVLQQTDLISFENIVVSKNMNHRILVFLIV